MSSTTLWLSIYQARPSATQWILWRKANKLWSAPKGRLHQPLGLWLPPNEDRRLSLPVYVHDNTLALRVHDAYQVYELDAYVRQVGSHRPTALRYEDLHPAVDPAEVHPAVDPAEVHEAPDGQWTVRSVTHRWTQRVHRCAIPLTAISECYHRGKLISSSMSLSHWILRTCASIFRCTSMRGVADGSVKFETNGSFGWIAANTEGYRVASPMGPARCAQMDSYHAECTGMLSLLPRFLIRLAMYTNMDNPWRGLLVGTDSQSMIDRLFYVAGTNNSTKQLAPLDVLDAEWDLLVEIQDALRELPGVDRTYVKGHQDDRVPYARLPLLAQLNVDADRLLAGDYHRDHGARRPFAFMAPNTGAFLVTDDGTLTSTFSPELHCSRSTSPRLEEYMRTKNKWDYCIFEQVKWVTHGKALKAFHPRRVHLTKFLHEVLPTFHLANLMDGGTRKCIACGSCDETIDHSFRCAAPSRVEWRQHWWQTVDEFHETHHATHPLLRHVSSGLAGHGITNYLSTGCETPDPKPERDRMAPDVSRSSFLRMTVYAE